MEQEKSNFDKLFRERLYDYETSPQADSWAAITKTLDNIAEEKNKKLQKVIIYTIAASILLMIVALPSILLHFNSDIKQEVAIKSTGTSSRHVDESSRFKEQSEPDIIETLKKTESQKIALTVIKSTARKKEVILPDGTKLFLNSNSTVSYGANFLKDRVVYMSGEVYFNVMHKNGASFIIYSELAKTEVLGTSFMVRSPKSTNADEVFVNSGKVAFSRKDGAGKVFLTAGDYGRVENIAVVKESRINDINFAAWKDEKIVFDNTKLDEVIATLSKYYRVPIKVSNQAILNCRFTGTFEKSDITEVLEVLAVSFNLTYNQQEGNYTLSGKGCG